MIEANIGNAIFTFIKNIKALQYDARYIGRNIHTRVCTFYRYVRT